jgi:hypothetical protein
MAAVFNASSVKPLGTETVPLTLPLI